MIRRVSKNQDLKDYIKSIPENVIDNVYTVRYYIYGKEDEYIEPSFTQSGKILRVVIPSQDLTVLSDGVLYRKVYYRETDVRFPDHQYNLEIEDNMDIWLYGESEDSDSANS